MNETALKPPKHLRAATKKWWSQVMADYELEPHHAKLLALAAETWDRCQQARELLDKHGLTYNDRFNAPCGRPEIAVERDSRLAFARLVRELGLDLGSPSDEGRDRPPRTVPNRGAK